MNISRIVINETIKNTDFKSLSSILENINYIENMKNTEKRMFMDMGIFMIKYSKIEMLNKLFELHLIIEIPYIVMRNLIWHALESKNPIILKIILDNFDANINIYQSNGSINSLIGIINPAIQVGRGDLLDMILVTFLKTNIKIKHFHICKIFNCVYEMIEKTDNFIILDKIITFFSRTDLNINFNYFINLDILNKILFSNSLKNERNENIYLFNKMLGLISNNIINIINSKFYINLCKFFISSRIVAIDYIFKNASKDYIVEINYKYNNILKIIKCNRYLLYDKINHNFNFHQLVNKIVNSKVKYNNTSFLFLDAIYKIIYSFL